MVWNSIHEWNQKRKPVRCSTIRDLPGGAQRRVCQRESGCTVKGTESVRSYLCPSRSQV